MIERLCADAFATEEILERTVASLRQALARSVEAPVQRAGLGLEDAGPEPPQTPLCAKVAGFSLHAARMVPAEVLPLVSGSAEEKADVGGVVGSALSIGSLPFF